jgi:hypothetical protein
MSKPQAKTLERIDVWGRENALCNIWRAIERNDSQQAIRIVLGSAQLKAEREAPPETMFKETSSRHRLMLKAAIEAAQKELAELKSALMLND